MCQLFFLSEQFFQDGFLLHLLVWVKSVPRIGCVFQQEAPAEEAAGQGLCAEPGTGPASPWLTPGMSAQQRSHLLLSDFWGGCKIKGHLNKG